MPKALVFKVLKVTSFILRDIWNDAERYFQGNAIQNCNDLLGWFIRKEKITNGEDVEKLEDLYIVG